MDGWMDGWMDGDEWLRGYTSPSKRGADRTDGADRMLTSVTISKQIRGCVHSSSSLVAYPRERSGPDLSSARRSEARTVGAVKQSSKPSTLEARDPGISCSILEQGRNVLPRINEMDPHCPPPRLPRRRDI